jgi:hypothetical protein
MHSTSLRRGEPVRNQPLLIGPVLTNRTSHFSSQLEGWWCWYQLDRFVPRSSSLRFYQLFSGGSRLFLIDSDWNPSHDLQAMARCHRCVYIENIAPRSKPSFYQRDGQKRPVFIYRLITAGTIDGVFGSFSPTAPRTQL